MSEKECPDCLSKDLSAKAEIESVPYGCPVQFTLQVEIEVYTCKACGISWTGHEASEKIDRAVAEKLRENS